MKQAVPLERDENAIRAAGMRAIWAQLDNVSFYGKLGLVGHHAVQALRSVMAAPFSFLVTTMTVTLALFVLAVFLLVLENTEHALTASQSDLKLTIFLREDAISAEVSRLREELGGRSEVERVEYVSKAQALKSFSKSLGRDNVILEGFDERNNPLPASVEVKFRPSPEVPQYLEEFAEQYAGRPFVERIEYGQGLIGQFRATIELFSSVGSAVMMVLLLATAFIIANTIRLALYAHREEVEIMKLVGATERFVKVPYLLEGAAQGVIGSVVATLAVWGGYLVLRDVSQSSTVLQLWLPDVVFLSGGSLLVLLLCGVVVGLGGSYLALRRYVHI